MQNIVLAICPICKKQLQFSSEDDFWSCRDSLRTESCPFGNCVVRERALANALFSMIPRELVVCLSIHEVAPVPRGLSLWFQTNVRNYIRSGYFPNIKFGEYVNGLRNEDIESQTFQDEVFDIVIHLDVMEHLFNPFKALNEIYRTLKPGGICMFTAPTDHNRFNSEQVAWLQSNGEIEIAGKPEYHGNPQRPDEGSLVTWKYGYDLPIQISRFTKFDVEVRRWQNKHNAIMGYMTEVYILKKISTEET